MWLIKYKMEKVVKCREHLLNEKFVLTGSSQNLTQNNLNFVNRTSPTIIYKTVFELIRFCS